MSWLSSFVRSIVGEETYYKNIRPVWRNPKKIFKKVKVGVKASNNGNGWSVRPMNPF
jgi:hypothetical protein